MPTKKIPEVISSESPSVTVPKSWDELSPKDFRYLCGLFASRLTAGQFDSLLFLHLAGIRIIGHSDDGMPLIRIGKKFYFINPEVGGVACESIQWAHEIAPLSAVSRLMPTVHKSAIDPRLNDMSFGRYIELDNLYTGYLTAEKDLLAISMAKRLWPRMRRVTPRCQAAAVICFSSIKNNLIQQYQDLFSDSANNNSDIFGHTKNSPAALRESVNAQIRALTKGDVTLEEKVLAAPVHRALTELNQLAKEYAEFKSKFN